MLITFIIVALILLAASVYFLLRALSRQTINNAQLQADDLVAIYRDKLLNLERQLKADEIDEQQYNLARQELELALANELPPADSSVQNVTSSRATKWIIAVALPVLAISLYLIFGTPGALSPDVDTDHATHHLAMEEMIVELENRLRDKPQDLQGWLLLGRSYASLNQPEKSQQALLKASTLAPDNPQILLDLAESFAQLNNNTLAGKPDELIDQALSVEPTSVRGRILKGFSHYQQARFTEANLLWIPLYQEPNTNDAERKLLSSLITAAGGTLPDMKPTDSPSIRVSVKLDSSLRDKVNPEDILFVYARAESGPPIPLAIKRYQVKNLPLTVTLDDEDAMTDQMKLSLFDKVIVMSRISKSGQPTPQSGDIQATSDSVDPKTSPSVELLINQILP